MIRKSWSFRASDLAKRLRFFIGLLALAALAPICRCASAPDWLVAAGKVDVGSLSQGSAAVAIGEWCEFTVDAAGKFTRTERCAIRVLNRQAAEPYLEARGYENNDTKISVIQSWSVSPSGRVLQSDKKDINTAADFGGYQLFSDDRMKFLAIPGAEDGSLVGYEIVSEGHIAIRGEQFDMEDRIPVKLAELRVSVPSGSMRWFVNHPDRIDVVSQSATTATFRSVDRPAIPRESDAPPWRSVAAMVAVNYDPSGGTAIQSWEDAGRTYQPIFVGAERPDRDVPDQADKLVASRADTLAKLDALYTFVSREVRYVAVEIGIGGYQPHPAPDVFHNRYGDCKDKANLLLTMMAHVGLRGYPALVGTRGDVEADPSVPTLATFDHMIVALPVPAELRSAVAAFPAYDPQTQILWIDPTSETAPLGQLPEMDQGVFSLITYPDRGELRRVPESPADRNGVDYVVRVRLAADGTGTADVETKYQGAFNASRHAFYRDRSQSDIRRMFDTRVANYASEATFIKASITGIEDNRQQIVEQFSFSGNFASAITGDSWFFQPLFLAGMDVPEVGTKPRRLPLDLGSPYRLKGEYRLELPAGMRVERAPEKVSIKSDYGELDTEYSLQGNVLVITHILSFIMSRVPPEKYGEFRDFVNAASRAERLRLRAVPAAQ